MTEQIAMTADHSTAQSPARKPSRPDKPYKDFPLFPHATRRWAKKVRGKLHYFGPWDDPHGALERWLDQRDDLMAGRLPRARGSQAGVSLRDLCNSFLTTKKLLLDAGELSIHTWNGYYAVCEELIETFGRDRLLADLLPCDFERLRAKWAAKWGVVRLGSEINRARVVFNYAYKNGQVEKPIRYGEGFARPSRKTLRLHRAAQGPRMFEAAELRRMIDAATQPMKSMLFLAINAAMGNNDIGQLPLKALDLERGWIVYPRPKTGISRHCPLWPETISAIREWLEKRPTPKDEANAALVFTTRCGGKWAKDTADRPITKECRKLLDGLGIPGKRNFYGIRHSFETIAGESQDQVAVDHIMGHAREDMASTYRERISDERLCRVTDQVRRWLFGKPSN
jgi:integrase